MTAIFPVGPPRRCLSSTRHLQRGVALIISLIFAIVIALVAIASIGGSVMEEKMVGNEQDQHLALQAAEAALRDAETDISLNIDPSTAFFDDCGTGLCIPASMAATPSEIPVWESISWTDASKTRVFGSGTGDPALPKVSAQPLYIIERLAEVPMAGGNSAAISNPNSTSALAYRITVRATGARPETRVMLQSIYVKP